MRGKMMWICVMAVSIAGAAAPAMGQGCPPGELFGLSFEYPVGVRPLDVAAADLDGDGHTDLAIANRDTDDASVLLNSGAGTFRDQKSYPAGDGPSGVALTDLDGDGDVDMVVVNRYSDDASVLLNNGDGTFAPEQRFDTGDEPRSLAMDDLNGDGHTDLVVGNYYGNDVSVHMGRGDGTFEDLQRYESGFANPSDVTLGDLDGDGDLDMVVANFFPTIDAVSILMNRGDGTFGEVQRRNTGMGPFSVTLADLNNDDNLDMVVSNSGAYDLARIRDVAIMIGNGDGTFQDPQRYAPIDFPTSTTVTDLDGDGALDIAVTSRVGVDIHVMRGRGDGTFQTSEPYGSLGSDVSYSLVFSDFDNDGDQDIALARQSRNDISVLPNRCGTFDCLVDMDGDGELTISDFLIFLNYHNLGDLRADFDGDREITIFDFLAFLDAFEAGCP